MTVLICNKITDRVRGTLKAWFIQPKANVFVSNLNNQLCQKIIQFLYEQSCKTSQFILIQSSNTGLGYKVIRIGKREKKMFNITGLDLF